MSSQLLTSVMEESYNFFDKLIKLSHCSKRKQKPTSPAKLTVSTRNKKETHDDSDDTLDSTEPGDISNNEFSDKSYLTDASTRRPGHQVSRVAKKTSTRLVNKPLYRPPLGLDALIPCPPGLGAPPGLAHPWSSEEQVSHVLHALAPPGSSSVPLKSAPWKQQDTRLNADAACFVPPAATALHSVSGPSSVPFWKHQNTRLDAHAACFVPPAATALHSLSGLNPDVPCFVPSLGAAAPEIPQKAQQVRESIKMLKGALEEWEANLPAPNPPAAQHNMNAPPGPKDNLAVLQEALTKLTPEQADMVRILLDQKVASENTPALIKDTLEQGAQKCPLSLAARIHPGAQKAPLPMQRPFTPFGGNCPQWGQVNQSTVVQKTAPKSIPQRAGFEESLKDHLRDLSELDSGRVLMVRKINRLGLDSPPLLKDYFTQFGSVERVMVAHTRCKVKGLEKGRMRPAPLGFVVMSTPEAAKAALANGRGTFCEHSVNGVDISVLPFESHTIDA